MNKFGVNFVTPFTESNEIDFDALKRIVENKLEKGIDRVVLGSRCGEFEAMTAEEIVSVAKFVREVVGDKAELVVSVGGYDIRQGILLLFNLMTCGVKYVIVKKPIINTNEKGLLNYYKTIIQSSPLPVFIETDESIDIKKEIEVLKEIGSLTNFAGVIEDSKVYERYVMLKSVLPTKELICGNDIMIFAALGLGITSIISSISNIWMDEVKSIIDNYLSGNVDVARNMYIAMYTIFEMMEVEPNPIPIKTTMNMLGYEVGDFRPPFSPMNPDHASSIIRNLMDMNLVKF